LIDFDGDLYGRSVHIDFVRQLRPSRKFSDVEALLSQIREDVERTRAILLTA
jgi:FAD synthase